MNTYTTTTGAGNSAAHNEAPSTNATWDRFLSDFSELYPADPADSATDEELAHAGVRLSH